jgi:nitrate/nitrite-specific signal transduction histidine kinase
MHRRQLLSLSTITLVTPWSLLAHAQVTDLNDAINKAGRQRMLSQRMGKAWLALVQGVETASAQRVLDTSLALFDRQHVELKAYASTPELKDTYQKLEAAWGDYKAALVGAAPNRSAATKVLEADTKVLALAHQGTVQYEKLSDKPAGKLVNIAGRQRMLSQRMGKFFMAAAIGVDRDNSLTEMNKARTEFISALEVLRTAPEATPKIKEELQLADQQWTFFDAALKRLEQAKANPKALSDVWVTSENLLTVMDKVTGLYVAIK